MYIVYTVFKSYLLYSRKIAGVELSLLTLLWHTTSVAPDQHDGMLMFSAQTFQGHLTMTLIVGEASAAPRHLHFCIN